MTTRRRIDLGGAVPSPAAAFLLAVIALPALFWLVMLKRTTVSTAPEEWLMSNSRAGRPRLGRDEPAAGRHPDHRHQRARQRVVRGPRLRGARAARPRPRPPRPGAPARPRHAVLPDRVGAEVLHLAGGDQPRHAGRRDLQHQRVGLDDIADFPAGHALRATVAVRPGRVLRRAPRARRPPGHGRRTAWPSSSSAPSARRASTSARTTRWTSSAAGWPAASLLAILVAIHVLRVDERARACASWPIGGAHGRGERRVAVPRRRHQPTEG